MFKHVCTLAMIALITGTALGIPATVNFQGAVKAGGLPYAGQGYFKFGVFQGSAKVWDNAGATTGDEPASAVTLPVANGVVSTALGSTAAGFAPLPLSAFGADATLRVWFSKTQAGPFERLTPDQPFSTVPYAAFSANAASAAMADTLAGLKPSSLARAPFATGFTSGLPSTCNLKVQIGAASPTAAVTFAGVEVVDFALDGLTGLPTGTPGYRPFSLRRKASTDTTWFTRMKTRTALGDVILILYNGTTELCRWKFAACQPVAWRLELADDGLPVERVDLQPASLVRTRASQNAQPVPGVFPQTNATSGFTGATYRVSLDGVAYPTYVVASSPGLQATDAGGTTVLQVIGVTLRQNPSADNKLFNVFSNWMNGTRTTVRLNLSVVTGSTTNTSLTLNPAAPVAYALYLADDGLPVEEFDMVATAADRP